MRQQIKRVKRMMSYLQNKNKICVCVCVCVWGGGGLRSIVSASKKRVAPLVTRRESNGSEAGRTHLGRSCTVSQSARPAVPQWHTTKAEMGRGGGGWWGVW